MKITGVRVKSIGTSMSLKGCAVTNKSYIANVNKNKKYASVKGRELKEESTR